MFTYFPLKIESSLINDTCQNNKQIDFFGFSNTICEIESAAIMKEFNGEEKLRKKVINKRKFFSAPNLPIDEMKVKGTDMFLVSPEDIRKYKKEMANKIGEEKSKKQRPTKKNKNKKLNSKEVDKILMEPIKSTDEEKKNLDDYQWLIKKNIIKLMGVAKKAQKERTASKKTETKSKPTKTAVHKTKSETAKENKREQNLQQRFLQLAKSEEQKHSSQPLKNTTTNLQAGRVGRSQERELKRDVLLRQRAIAATLPRYSEPLPRQRGTTPPVLYPSDRASQQRANLAILHPANHSVLLQPEVQNSRQGNTKRTGMQKLKNIFNVFKSTQETVPPKVKGNKKLDVVYSGELHKQAQTKLELEKITEKGKPGNAKEPKKRVFKKSNKIPEKIMKKTKARDNGSAANLKTKQKPKKKILVSASPSAYENKTTVTKHSQTVEVPSGSNRVVAEKKRLKKSSPQKLLYTVSA
jgi:hypothetical protein